MKHLIEQLARRGKAGRSGQLRRLRRRLRTQSVLSLQLAGFALVALPLLVGLIVSAQQIGRVTRHSEQLLERAIEATQSTRRIADRATAFERAARQYRILMDADARASLLERHRQLGSDLAAFTALVERRALAERARTLAGESRRLHRLTLELKADSEWPDRLAESFERLGAHAGELLAATEAAASDELEALEAMGKRARSVALLSLIVALPIVLLLALLMAASFNRRIRQLDRGMRALAHPDRARIEQVTSPRDLRALSVRLEWVRRRLVRTERERRQFVGQISHELKTPLSAIREGTSLLADQGYGRLGERQQEVIDIIQTNILRLQEQIENLLRFNRLQSRPTLARRAAVSLDALIERVLDSHRLGIDSRRIAIQRAGQAGLEISADPDMLATALDNLVSNALKYSPPGETIGIETARDEDRVVIRVADRGPGVPAADRARLFEPFYRGASRYNRRLAGSGLGLAICRDLVRAHGGEVRLVEHRRWSAVFAIELPIEPSGDSTP